MSNALLVLWDDASEEAVKAAIEALGYAAHRTVTGIGDVGFIVPACGAKLSLLSNQLWKAVWKVNDGKWCTTEETTWEEPPVAADTQVLELMLLNMTEASAIDAVNRIYDDFKRGDRVKTGSSAEIRACYKQVLKRIDDIYAGFHGVGLLFSSGNQEIIDFTNKSTER